VKLGLKSKKLGIVCFLVEFYISISEI